MVIKRFVPLPIQGDDAGKEVRPAERVIDQGASPAEISGQICTCFSGSRSFHS
jgi:hypothetical protein